MPDGGGKRPEKSFEDRRGQVGVGVVLVLVCTAVALGIAVAQFVDGDGENCRKTGYRLCNPPRSPEEKVKLLAEVIVLAVSLPALLLCIYMINTVKVRSNHHRLSYVTVTMLLQGASLTVFNVVESIENFQGHSRAPAALDIASTFMLTVGAVASWLMAIVTAKFTRAIRRAKSAREEYLSGWPTDPSRSRHSARVKMQHV